MYQQITLIGNLGNDPEMRYTPSGVPVTSFRMAVSKSYTSQDGQRQEKTMWFSVTAWRKLAETASQYLTKGSKVLVVGELDEARAYTDREGNLRASLEVTANTIRFLSTKGGGDGSMGTAAPAGAAAPGAPELHEEDIPF